MIARYCSKATVALVILTLFGCVQPVPVYQPVPGPVGPAAAPVAAPGDADVETDLVPPVPTFTTVADCEMAYGPGACGSGAAVYGQANLAPPPDAGTWFMPFAFGVMTGVLVNRFYAPPTVYVADVRYSQFIAPVVIEKYRIVTPATVRFYHAAPLGHRQSVMRTGPVRYAPRRGEFVGNPYGHGYTRPPGPPQRPAPAPGTLAPSRQPTPIGERPGVRPPGAMSQPQKPLVGTPTPRPVPGTGAPKPTTPTTGGTTPTRSGTTTQRAPSTSVQPQRPTAPRPSTPAAAPKKPVPKPAPGEKGQSGR
jgi:hypothetical protein